MHGVSYHTIPRVYFVYRDPLGRTFYLRAAIATVAPMTLSHA